MSEQPQPPSKVPAVEKPSESAKDKSSNPEYEFLQKQASSSNLRDVVERRNHNQSNEIRLSILQAKLDIAEDKIENLLPRNATLEQSMRVSKVLVRDGTVVMAIAGTAVSCASLFDQQEYRFLIAGFGGGFLILGPVSYTHLTLPTILLV